MSETLFIRLASYQQQAISWLIWSTTEQEIIASGELNHIDELSQLQNHAQLRQCILLIPGSDVVFKTVMLPGRFNRQLQTAIPYMIEEEMAEDVDELFFAYGEKIELDGKPGIEVAIIQRELLESWLAACSEAGIYLDQVVPDVLGLPSIEESWVTVEINGQWLMRQEKWMFSCIDNDWLTEYFSITANQIEGNLTIAHYSPLTLIEDNITLTAQAPELPLKLLAEGLLREPFNLLQGEFAQESEYNKLWFLWRPAAVIAMLALFLQVLSQGATWWQLDQQLTQAEEELKQTYTQAFPQETFRNNLVRRQLNKKLKALNLNGSTDVHFLAIISELTSSFGEVNAFKPTGIKYDQKKNEIRVQANADGFQTFELFKAAVEKQGFNVEQGSLNNDDGIVVGSLTIMKKANS